MKNNKKLYIYLINVKKIDDYMTPNRPGGWDIKQGDYQRSEQYTNRYDEMKKRKKFIRSLLIIVAVVAASGAVAFMVL